MSLRASPEVRSAIVEKAVKTPERPDGFKLEVLTERQPAENRSIQPFRGFFFPDGDDPPLPRNLVHADELESVFGGLSFFDFQIPNLFELESALNVPPHLHKENHRIGSSVLVVIWWSARANLDGGRGRSRRSP